VPLLERWPENSHISPNRNPLFQLVFSHEDPDEADFVLDGASVTRIPLDHHSMPAAFDLGMFIRFTGNVTDATVRLYYSPEVFNQSTIDQMVRSYLSCLTSGTTDVLAPISVSPVPDLAMPDSLNRSLDTGSGPIPPRPHQLSSAVRGAPTAHTERAIAAIWQTVLGCELLDPEDDFFDSGGNSLLALQVVNRIEESLNIRLNVSTLFSARSIQALTEVVNAELWRRGSDTSSQGRGFPDASSHGRDFEVGTL
jgi:acyl carrier protein